jgi:hypothetical protein
MGKKVSGVEGFRAADLVNPVRGIPVVPGKLNEAGFREHVDAGGGRGIDAVLLEELKQRVDSVWSCASVDSEVDFARDCLESIADAGTSPEVFQALKWPIQIVTEYISLLMKMDEKLGDLFRDPRDEAEKKAKGE